MVGMNTDGMPRLARFIVPRTRFQKEAGINLQYFLINIQDISTIEPGPVPPWYKLQTINIFVRGFTQPLEAEGTVKEAWDEIVSVQLAPMSTFTDNK